MIGDATTIEELLTAIVAGVGAFGLYAGGKKALADARATKKVERTPYELLMARTAQLEERMRCSEESDRTKGEEIDRLRKQVSSLARALSTEVTHILDWIDDGSPPPPPTRSVTSLRDLIRDLDKDI